MAETNCIDIDELRQLLNYNPETGELFWIKREVEMFPSQRACNSWNAKFAGKVAFPGIKPNGYRRGWLPCRKVFAAHRVIWALHYGKWPEDQIDHINGIRHDNRIINLRIVTSQGNARNHRAHPNAFGFHGVRWHAKSSMWQARIGVNYKSISLGYFKELKMAADAYQRAKIQYGFHPNHGILR